MYTEDPDYRDYRLIPAKLLEIDPSEQRDINGARDKRIALMSMTWDEKMVGTLLVRETEVGALKVIDGQARAKAMNIRDPERLLPCYVFRVSAAEAARMARRLSEERTPHTSLDKWKLSVREGKPHELAAEDVLSDRQLHLGNNNSAWAISSVSMIRKIVYSSGEPRAGARALAQLLDIIRGAYPDGDVANGNTRWHGSLLRAVYQLQKANPERFDPIRMQKALAERPTMQWINLQKKLPEELFHAYNRGLKKHVGRRLEWI